MSGDNPIHVAVNFGASATTEVSTGLVEQSVVIHYCLAFLGEVPGTAEMCSLSAVPRDGGTFWVPGLVGR